MHAIQILSLICIIIPLSLYLRYRNVHYGNVHYDNERVDIK